MPFAPHRCATTAALTALMLVASTTTHAQIPAAYEATPHGRVLACFGAAYALVELIDVATQNLSLLSAELQREPTAARPALAAGLVLSGTQVDQRQSVDVAERLMECTESAAKRATADVGSAFTAAAVREEIDIAIMMADGFTSDYQMLAARLMQFFGESTEPATKSVQTRPLTRFGDDVRAALVRSRTAIDLVIARSGPRP